MKIKQHATKFQEMRVLRLLMVGSVLAISFLTLFIPHSLFSHEKEAKLEGQVCGRPELLFPLYIYPNWYDPDNYFWDDLATISHEISTTVILNPNSGPDGCPPNEDYSQGLADLAGGNISLIGYVLTNYGERDLNVVKSEIDQYAACYAVDGIFLDESSNDNSHLAYYQVLSNYIREGKGLAKVYMNPGTNTSEAYIQSNVADVFVTFEGDAGNWSVYDVNEGQNALTANRFATVIYGVTPKQMPTVLNEVAARNFGSIYITDDVLPNPFDAEPSYLINQVQLMHSISSCNYNFLSKILTEGEPDE